MTNSLSHLLHDESVRPVWRGLLLLLLATVCVLAFSPGMPQLHIESADKWQHIAAFAALAACAALAWPPGPASSLAIAAAMLGFGLFIEAVQHFIPARSSEWMDVLADLLGVVLGLAAVAVARRCWPRRALAAPRVR